MARPATRSKEISIVAANLVAFRKSRGWTQQALADALKTDLSKIARTEVGILKPSVELVEIMIEKLGVTADELFHPPQPPSAKEAEIRELQAAIKTLSDKQRASVRLLVEAYRNKLFAKVMTGPTPITGPGIDDT